MAECTQVFERIYSGELKDQVIFRSEDPANPVFAVLALKQATKGHTVIASTECVPSLDLVSPRAHGNITAVTRATGIWLQAAFEPRYVGEMVAGVEVAHAHAHRIPCYDGRDWLKVMGAGDPKPFPEMSPDEKAEVFGRATFAPEFAVAVQVGITTGEEALPDTLVEMAYDLRTPTRRSE